MGIPLAYALLTIVLHAYNCTEKMHGKRLTKPIGRSHFHDTPAMDLKPIGIMPEVRKQGELIQSDHFEIDKTANTLDTELIVPKYLNSLAKYKVMKLLEAMGLTRLQKSAIKFEQFHVTQDITSTDSNLRQTLFDYGLRLQAVNGDGNCFFTSIACNMLSNLSVWNQCLTLAGTTNEVTIEELSGGLRYVYVEELLGERRAQYEAFIAHTTLDFEKEAKRFQIDKFFDSELGNTMPLALATALQFTIVIFHNNSVTPVMYVSPDIVTTEATAFVVYTHSKVGHYDVAIPCHQCTTMSNVIKFTPCS